MENILIEWSAKYGQGSAVRRHVAAPKNGTARDFGDLPPDRARREPARRTGRTAAIDQQRQLYDDPRGAGRSGLRQPRDGRSSSNGTKRSIRNSSSTRMKGRVIVGGADTSGRRCAAPESQLTWATPALHLWDPGIGDAGPLLRPTRRNGTAPSVVRLSRQGQGYRGYQLTLDS